MNTPDPFNGKLFTRFDDGFSYPSDDALHSHLFEQYKLYVEMVDRSSARRQTANSYFLTVNTGLLGFVGFLTTRQETATYIWLLGFAGITLSVLWYWLVRSYRDLNTAKFAVIHAIEKRLPLSLYDAEWEALGRGKRPDLYRPFTHIEIGVPFVFLLLHSVVFLHSFPSDALRGPIRNLVCQ